MGNHYWLQMGGARRAGRHFLRRDMAPVTIQLSTLLMHVKEVPCSSSRKMALFGHSSGPTKTPCCAAQIAQSLCLYNGSRTYRRGESLLAASGKFESERLCSYNKGATWGDVGC